MSDLPSPIISYFFFTLFFIPVFHLPRNKQLKASNPLQATEKPVLKPNSEFHSPKTKFLLTIPISTPPLLHL